MGRLIEQQAVIDCLTNTAKYYEREDADEWTKGIHYGLLHGVDNILDNVPTVEAIPKADYEARLMADLVDRLDKIRAEIEQDAFKDVNGSKYIFVNRVNQILTSASQKVSHRKVRMMDESISSM